MDGAFDGWLGDVAGLSFRSHIEKAFPGVYKYRRFHDELVDTYQDFHDGKLLLPDGQVARNLFVAIEQQTGKTTWWQLGCSWEMTLHPLLCAGFATGTEKKALRGSKFVRKFYREAGGVLEGKASHNWSTAAGGEFWAVSTGQSGAGLPSDILFFDDTSGGRRESESSALYAEHVPWMTEMMARRRKIPVDGIPPFRIVSIGTRQGLSDIGSKILSLGGFYCVILPTLFSPDGCGRKETWYLGPPLVGPFPPQDGDPIPPDQPWAIPNSVLRPDWRQPGGGLVDDPQDDLSPEGFERRRSRNAGGWIDDPTLAANQQAAPSQIKGGGIFQARFFNRTPTRPTGGQAVRSYDFGATLGGGHATASIETTRITPNYYLRHGCRAWLDPRGVKLLLAAMAILDGPKTAVSIPIPKADGGDRLESFDRWLSEVFGWIGLPRPHLHGQTVATSRPPGDDKTAKFYRITGPGSFADLAKPLDWDEPDGDIRQHGRVWIVTEPWKPSMREIVPDFERLSREHPELAEMERLALAATEQLDSLECRRLNVDPLPWEVALIDQCQGMSPYSTGNDDYPDAGADGFLYLKGKTGGMPWFGV